MVILPDFEEILRSLRGAWRLFRRDETGYEQFSNTIGGFWRSFAVIILIFPFYFIAWRAEQQIIGIATKEAPAITGDVSFATVALALILGWFAYPAVMALLVRIFHLGGRYVPYIIAYNWTALLIMGLLMPPFLLFLTGVIEAGTAMGINFSLTLFALYFHWYVAFTALKTTAALAAAFVAIDFLLSVIINIGVHRLAG